MTRLPLLAATLLLAESASAIGPFVTTLPAQRLACTAGESAVESVTSDSLKALRARVVEAEIDRTGFPFFREVEPVAAPPTKVPAAEQEAAQDAERAAPPADERLSWRICVPIRNQKVEADLEVVEAPPRSVAVLIVPDLDIGCAEELEAHLAEASVEEATRPPRSLPFYQEIDGSSAETRLEPFLTTEALAAAELTSFAAAAKIEPIDRQLTGELDVPRPLFVPPAELEQDAGPTQTGVICLVEIPDNAAEVLAVAWKGFMRGAE